MSNASALAVEILVERLRSENVAIAQKLDQERARNKRLWNENASLNRRVRELEAERARMIEALAVAMGEVT